MKRALLTISIVVLLASGCNVSSTPSDQTPVIQNSTPTSTSSLQASPQTNGYITKQQAIDIVVKEKHVDLSTQNIQATFKNNNWEVNTWPKPPLKCPTCAINGGNAEYTVDGKTGKIISSVLGQ